MYEIMLVAAQSQSLPLVHYLVTDLKFPLIIEEVKGEGVLEEQVDFYHKLNII